MSDNFNKNRLAKNTILLYVRMLFTMWLNLYTTRLTLANLGVEDMGIYGVVGSIVSMFAVFSSGMGNAVQRFLTYEIGRDNGDPNKVFCSCLNVIFLLSGIIFILLEAGGLWFLHTKINIPAESMDAAQWVFQISVLTSIVNILQVILTCASAYCLSYFPTGRLLIYAILMATISILIRIAYQIYCHRKFPEVHYHMLIDKNQIMQIGKFAGISSASGALQVLSSQGFILVINLTFGVAINAVYTISMQLKNSVLSFAQNLQRAIAPQITKTYANGELDIHKKLVYAGSKFQVFLIFFIMIPFLFQTEYIMQLWLGNVPPYAVTYAQCTIFLSLTYASFETIRTAVYATGNITKFMIWPEAIYLLVLPISYYTGIITNNPNDLIIAMVLYEIFVCTIRVWIASKVSIIKINELLKKVIKPCFCVAVAALFICKIITLFIPQTIWGLISILCLNSISLSLIIIVIGLSKQEKNMISTFLKNKMK